MIHAKIYLIDDVTAYLGSLNFTKSGRIFNYETRIKTTDIQAFCKIREEISNLFYSSELPKIDIQKWGSELYEEPIN